MKLNLSRGDLIRACGEISINPPALTHYAAAVSKQVLALIIDQLPPRRDSRIELLPWTVANHAVGLLKFGMATSVELALIEAIEFYMDGKPWDVKFLDYCARVYRRLKKPGNPAEKLLLPPSEALLVDARKVIEERKRRKRTRPA